MLPLWQKNDSDYLRDAVVIVGGGLSGVMVAHFLRKKEPNGRIVLIDMRGICGGATGRNGGQIWPRMSSDLEKKGAKIIVDLVKEMDLDCGLNLTGSIHLSEDGGGDSLQEHLPELSSKYRVKTWSHELSGTLNPYAFGRQLFAKIPNIDLIIGHVQAVDHARQMILYSEGGLKKELKFCQLVLATNAWSAQLDPSIPIIPTRAQVCHLKTEFRLPYCLGVGEGINEYIAPTQEGMVFGGCRRFGENNESGVLDDSVVNPRVSKALDATARRMFPSAKMEKLTEWTGIMGFTPDGSPLVGRWQSDRVFLIAGFHGHGMPVAPIAAQLLVGQMTGSMGRENIPESWRADRFYKAAKL